MPHGAERRAGATPPTGRHLRVDPPTRRPLALYGLIAIIGVAVGMITLGQSAASEPPLDVTSFASEPTAPLLAAAPGQVVPEPPMDDLTSGWVAVFAMVDRDDGQDALEAALAPMRGVVPSARVIETDTFPSLPPGRWAVVDGPFPSGKAAVAYCLVAGADADDPCSGRVLSALPTDRDRACRFDGGYVGDCDN